MKKYSLARNEEASLGEVISLIYCFHPCLVLLLVCNLPPPLLFIAKYIIQEMYCQLLYLTSSMFGPSRLPSENISKINSDATNNNNKKMFCKFCKNSFIFVFLANHFQLIDRLCLPWFQSIMVNQATQPTID